MNFSTKINQDNDVSFDILNENVKINGILHIPQDARGIVLFAHGSGSSRFSTRNHFVARVLQQAKLATLLFDLFTPEEEELDEQTRELRFNIPFLASRLISATEWVSSNLTDLPIGYFGASTGGGAAIMAAAQKPDLIKAVVSRGGRPDLAAEALTKIIAPTLLIVGGNDSVVIELNEEALQKMHCEKKLVIVPGATHLFEEPGTLDLVAHLAKSWFSDHIKQ